MTKNDLFSNFFAQKEDVDTNSRADITQRGLMEINNFAIVMIFKGELSNDFSILNEYNLVIITEIISLETAQTLNQYCRMKHIGFIYTCEFGLSSFLFTDFGDDFIIEDNNGLEPNKYYIKSISNSCPGIVEIDPIKNNLEENIYLNIGTGDFVSFKDVKGMTELNDTPPRPIRVINKTKFTIEDTTKFQEFTGVGIVEEVKVPRPAIFKPLSEAINVIYYEDVIEDYLNEDSYLGSTASKMSNEPLMDDLGIISNIKTSQDNIIINEEKKENIPWIKMFYAEFENESLKNLSNEKMHLAFLALHEYFNIHQDLPNFNKIKENKECIDISLKILSKAKEEGFRWAINLCKIDKPFLDNVFKFCKFKFTPFTNYLAGIVAQEVIKFTGLYKPISQWVYFNFFNLLNISKVNDIIEKRNLTEENDKENNIEPNILNIFNEIYNEQIKDVNILIIGFNDISYEMIKLFIILGLLDNKENKIKVVSNNKYDIKEKLEELKHLGKKVDISIIQEKLDLNDNNNINNNYLKKDWWINSNIIIDTLPFDSNEKEKISLIKNSKENKKILISLNYSKYSANSEIFLPEIKSDNYIIEETPKPQEEKNEIKIVDDYNDEEDYDKYKNICTLDEALNWSRNYFQDNFIKYIKYLIELINKSHSESDMNKFYLSKKKTKKILTYQ